MRTVLNAFRTVAFRNIPVHNRPLITDVWKQTTLITEPFITDNLHDGLDMNRSIFNRDHVEHSELAQRS